MYIVCNITFNIKPNASIKELDFVLLSGQANTVFVNV
jgi:hypothetical protein